MADNTSKAQIVEEGGGQLEGAIAMDHNKSCMHGDIHMG
jgi:hypothetical protein